MKTLLSTLLFLALALGFSSTAKAQSVCPSELYDLGPAGGNVENCGYSDMDDACDCLYGSVVLMAEGFFTSDGFYCQSWAIETTIGDALYAQCYLLEMRSRQTVNRSSGGMPARTTIWPTDTIVLPKQARRF